MKKDPTRYTPHPYGHAAPWNRPAVPAYTPRRAEPKPSGRWPWVLVAALVVATLGWLVYDVALS